MRASSPREGDRAGFNVGVGAEKTHYAGLKPSLLRILYNALCALTLAPWLGVWSLVWLAASSVFEIVAVALIWGKIIQPAGRRGDERLARLGGTAIVFGASLIYGVGLCAAWAMGGAEAGFAVGVLYAGMVTHAIIYLSTRWEAYIACVGPPTFFCLIGAVLAHQGTGLLAFSLFTIGQVMLTGWLGRTHRNGIMERIWKLRTEAKTERDASLAKSQFLATMSHELRTPLNAVIGYAEILEEELREEKDDIKADDAARIRRSARELLTLINEILDFSKIEAGRVDIEFKECDVGALLHEVAETIAPAAAENRTHVHVEIEPAARRIVTDPQRLKQCLFNLASNAAKFTEGGEIVFRARMEEDHDRAMLRVDVIDTGCGVREEDRPRLFQPFVQVDSTLTRKRGGTGLGLVITQRLATLLGGDVRFESEVGKGSTFTVRVEAHAEPAAVDGEGPLVLMIDDEASARDLMRRTLSRLPVRVCEAATALEGLTRARAEKPALIVLDIHLPDRSGWDVLAELKADPTLSAAPVLVVTIDDDRARALRLGACDQMVKPVTRESFAAAVLRYARIETPRAIEASRQGLAQSA